MIDLVGPRLTLYTMMLLVAISATFFAVFAFSGNFPKVRSPSEGIIATLAWTLATALPALWVGAAGKYPPRDVLIRFGIANGIFAILLGANFNPRCPSRCWSSPSWCRRWDGMPGRRCRPAKIATGSKVIACTSPYFIQFTATVFTLIAATAVMEKTCRVVFACVAHVGGHPRRALTAFRGHHTQIKGGIRYGVPGMQAELGMVSPECHGGIRYDVPGMPEDFAWRRDLVGTIEWPATREGKVLYAIA